MNPFGDSKSTNDQPEMSQAELAALMDRWIEEEFDNIGEERAAQLGEEQCKRIVTERYADRLKKACESDLVFRKSLRETNSPR